MVQSRANREVTRTDNDERSKKEKIRSDNSVQDIHLCVIYR